MSLLAERIQKDLVSAMKAGEKHKVETLRGLTSDLKYRRIALGHELADADVEATLKQAAKRRRESIEVFKSGGRVDLVAKEESELAIITAYLPPELSDAELDVLVKAAVDESGPRDPSRLGQIMKVVMPRVGQGASGDRVRSRVMGYLQAGG
jgi:uncharacterized protein YqeY